MMQVSSEHGVSSGREDGMTGVEDLRRIGEEKEPRYGRP